MKSIYVTGYKPYELNIFNNKQPEVRYIKLYFQQKLKEYIEDGLEWVIIEGQLGVELWAAEVVIRLKKMYDVKLSIITPFLEHHSKWNEENQLYYKQICARADFITSAHNDVYRGGFQFRNTDQFVLDNTEGTILFYDDEYEASPKFFKQTLIDFAAENQYNIDVVTMEDLSDFVNEYIRAKEY
ncbi:DUF1273 domain-containing protein [Macrococcoides canis]|uniref:DUF1273 domain-containing protein n=1 Tax=Macrococcoides canis TaxID=1855823 RepID=UPI0013E91758|nr:DUF1273 domain-containing protein [Macrococcus canis]MCO4095454.1 DUF1273 domain-containing protein [Macrococcus canis]QIH75957.1 DUF1273 family protein [Macrococcus canis]QTQ07114.1 DUF1273 domain-containing protein [Macrococcus canis]UTH01360.1 DUF1273 domain-containing protein [Macrococcus canis]UTH08176.1 DUF1273 domain-containing protein [Macrococcus canis]